MQTFSVDGVKITHLASVVGEKVEENPSSSKDVIGFKTLCRAKESDSALSLQLEAAKKLNLDFSDFGALISVSFTNRKRMPNLSAQASSRLGFPKDAFTLDISAACSGYGYALYTAALFVKSTGKKALLIDGDKQSDFLSLEDEATRAVLADGASATVLERADEARPWRFIFETEEDKFAALTLEEGGKIKMDGYAVFRYVATEVSSAIKRFFEETKTSSEDYDFFVPHQANLFMVRQLAKSLGFSEEKTIVNTQAVGNLASASIPYALSSRDLRGRRILASGFGGGLSLFVADLTL